MIYLRGIFINNDELLKNKYGNKKTEVENITFSSAFEAKAYKVLLELKKNGLISNLILQPKFVLQDAFECAYYDGSVEKVKAGKLREITYVSDFSFEYKDKKIVLETKGMPDQKYPIKKKLFLYKYNKYYFLEIRRVRELNKIVEILDDLLAKKDAFDKKLFGDFWKKYLNKSSDDNIEKIENQKEKQISEKGNATKVNI